MSELTDEHLRKMLTDQDSRSYGDEGRLDPYVASDILTELLALRSERAKPTQTGRDDKDWWSKSPFDRLRIRAKSDPDLSLLVKAYDGTFEKAASIRAEGSAERAELEAALRIAKRYVETELDIVNDEQDIAEVEADLAVVDAALARPAESRATERPGCPRDDEPDDACIWPRCIVSCPGRLFPPLAGAKPESGATESGYIDPDNGQYVGPHAHVPSPRQPNAPTEDEDFSGCAISRPRAGAKP